MAGVVGAPLAGARRTAAAPGRGGGMELLVFAAGALLVYVLWIASRRHVHRFLRRLFRYLGLRGVTGLAGNNRNYWDNRHRRYRG